VNRFFDDRSRYVDRFGWLLVLTATTVVVLALVDLGAFSVDTARWATVLVTALVAATMSLAQRATGTTRLWQRIVDTILAIRHVAVVLLALITSTTSDASVTAAPAATVLLAAIAPAVVVRRLLHHRRAARATLLAAISAYLLIALAFYYAFLAVDQYEQADFFGEAQPTSAFMYFSLTTITTLGYGDLAAHTEIGRLLATTEAVVGQVYLVTLVAMVVSLLAQNWFERPPDDATRAQGGESDTH
jgi:hypothetical protein